MSTDCRARLDRGDPLFSRATRAANDEFDRQCGCLCGLATLIAELSEKDFSSGSTEQLYGLAHDGDAGPEQVCGFEVVEAYESNSIRGMDVEHLQAVQHVTREKVVCAEESGRRAARGDEFVDGGPGFGQVACDVCDQRA